MGSNDRQIVMLLLLLLLLLTVAIWAADRQKPPRGVQTVKFDVSVFF